MSKRRRTGSGPAGGQVDANAFWSRPARERGAGGTEPIRATTDPSAVPRSLGDPPLPARPGMAGAHLVAAYEEAVRAAKALAAVNGLLAPEGDGAGG
ncbi:MAG: hypothetical protein ACRDY0_03920 [Acidimicrobiales bacterium]